MISKITDLIYSKLSLESELVEEILNACRLLITLSSLALVLLLEHLLDSLLGLDTVGLLVEGGLVNDLLKVEVDGVSARSQRKYLHQK
jgi:hypothetical protein